jgi:NAD-dependent dihydropyrimidine dehydrogenase PreA subunit
MVHKGEIASMKMFGAQVYVVVPFIVGIYEFQLDRMDKELAELIEEYAPALMNTLGGFSPALTRVIPISRVIEGDHQVLRHEDVEAIFKKAKSFQLMDCICRKERKLQGHECSHESETCLAFSNQEDAFERTPRGRKIDKEQALAVIKKCEEAGLVHTTYNVQSGQMFMCNCCSCCCGLLRGMSAFKAPHLMAKSNFTAMVDPETCIGCGVCADERCPVKAIEPDSDKFKVNPDRCIGCGVCLPTCPVEAIQLVRKPEEGVELPPENLMDWYFKRAESRGIKIIV